MQKRIGVIFVSRRNSLRSILAEACLSHLDSTRFSAFSCGQPGQLANTIHPAAIGALQSASMTVPNRAPRSWDEFARSSSPVADFIITLDAATEPLQPPWPGQPDAALWAYPDAVANNNNAEATAHAAIQMLFSLRRRLELLVSLPMQGVDRAAVRSDVRDLGYMR